MKKRLSASYFLMAALLITGLAACVSDPVIPATGVPVTPPEQDPGEVNICPDGIISFQHQILPLMVSACAYSGCHDPISHREGIVLDNYDGILRKVRPGNPSNSKLYKSLIDSEDDIMPPPPAQRLTSEQIAMVRTWIEQGAENTDCGIACDPELSSFSAVIFPLIQNNCIGCHSNNRQDGMVNLSSYEKIIPHVNNGSLLGTIRQDQYYPIMPPSGSQLSECRIMQIKKWIDEGAQNN